MVKTLDSNVHVRGAGSIPMHQLLPRGVFSLKEFLLEFSLSDKR